MRIEPELGGCSIVLLGNFNPTIFSPAWFGRNGLVTEAEANEAVINVIHPEIASMKIGKMRLQVELNRLTAEIMEAPWVDVSDFVVRTLGEFLIHTPVNQVGINRQVHFGVGTEEKRNAIGALLAPTSPWGEWGEKIRTSKPPLRGGVVSLTMTQRKEPEEGISGHVQCQVQPSTRIGGNAGIFINVNDHSHLGNIEEIEGCTKAVVQLAKNFDSSIKYAESIIDQVMSLKDKV